MFRPLRTFSFRLAAALIALMLLVIFTPAARFYIFVVQDMTEAVGNLAMSSVILFMFFPALAALTSWLRGLLINEQATKAINVGMGINLTVTAVGLIVGVLNQLPGLPTAAIALNIASAAEVAYLSWRAGRVLTVGMPLFGLQRAKA